jgi:hypothetical protein
VLRHLKREVILFAAIAITLIAVGVYEAQRGPPLKLGTPRALRAQR